jgi:hypothetical protein
VDSNAFVTLNVSNVILQLSDSPVAASVEGGGRMILSGGRLFHYATANSSLVLKDNSTLEISDNMDTSNTSMSSESQLAISVLHNGTNHLLL